MKTFRFYLHETTVYEMVVEAENPEQAEELAWEQRTPEFEINSYGHQASYPGEVMENGEWRDLTTDDYPTDEED